MVTCKVKDTSFSICYQLCELSYILEQSNWPFSLIILFWSRNISLIIHFHGPNILIIINKWLLQLYDFFIQHKFSLFLVGSDEHNLEVVSREKNIYYFENIELEKICIWDKLTFSSIAWNHRLNFMSCRDALHGVTGIDSWYHVQGIVAIPFMNFLSQGFNPWFRLSSLQAFFSEEKKQLIMEWLMTL